jgi:hypothetical protein
MDCCKLTQKNTPHPNNGWLKTGTGGLTKVKGGVVKVHLESHFRVGYIRDGSSWNFTIISLFFKLSFFFILIGLL